VTTMNSQLGIVNEVTYGTPLTVTRFFEYDSESVALQTGRVESPSLRSGTRVLRSDRFEPYRMGAAGNVVMPVPTKGFGIWLTHMLGGSSIGSVTDGNQTQTHVVGPLLGDFFTMQIGKPFNPSGTVQPFTYHGCKVTGWTLSCDLDGFLTADIAIDAEDEDTSTALATASYPADFRCFSFTGAALTIASTSIEVRNFSVSGDNALDTNRRYLRNSALKKEPVENGMRTYEWSCTADFSDLTQYNRFSSATRAGAVAAIVATFDGPVAHAGTTLPRLEITIPVARFDDVSQNISGPEALTQDISGVALFDGTNSPVSITYRTSDTAI
jgi:hypothetical protein